MPAGRSVSVIGSKVTGSRPAACSSSSVSAYRKVKAGPPATATTGRGAGRTASGARRAADGLDRVPRPAVELGSRSGDLEHGVEVDVVGDQRGEPVDGGAGLVPLLRRHEPEVTGRRLDRGVARQHAEHRHPGGLERRPGLAQVPGRAGPVEHDPGHADRRVEGGEPVHDRGRGAGRVADVDREHDRGAGERGHVRRRAETVAAESPVEEPHDALDDGDVGGAVGPRGVQQQRLDECLAAEHRVEVAPGAAGREGVVARVDEVGPDLEAADGVPGGAQGSHEPGGDRRLAVARAGRGDDDAGQARPGRIGGGALTTRSPAGPSGRRRRGA